LMEKNYKIYKYFNKKEELGVAKRLKKI